MQHGSWFYALLHLPPLFVRSDMNLDDSEHSSSRDITLMSETRLSDTNSVAKEKCEVSPPREVETHKVAMANEDDFPDGGLRAWLIVAGVRHVYYCAYHYTGFA